MTTTRPDPRQDPSPDGPLGTLMRGQDDRQARARALVAAHDDLVRATAAYRTAWTAATRCGWARTDLRAAGLVDPARLPRDRRRAPAQDGGRP